MSRPGGFRFPTAAIPPLGGLNRGPVTAPFGEPGSQRAPDNTTTTNTNMFPHQQLVPTVRRGEVSEEQRQAYIPVPSNNLDNEDSGDDDFHDAQEDQQYDFSNSFGANNLQNAAPAQPQGYQSFALPQTRVFNAPAGQYAAPPQQPQQTNGFRDMMDLTGDDANEHTNLNHDQSYNEWDEWAASEEDLRDNGVYLDQYAEQDGQHVAQDPQHQVNGGFSFDQRPPQFQANQFNGGYPPEQHPQQYQEGQTNSHNASMSHFGDIGIPDPNAEDETEAPQVTPDEEDGDLFSSTFGHNVKDENDDSSDLEILDAPAFDAALKAKGLSLDPTFNGLQHRIPTPPLPGQAPGNTSDTAPTTRPKRERPAKDIYGNPFDGRVKAGPCKDRDLSTNLRAHYKFHSKVFDLVPRVPNWEDLDWKRRYWIAVLLEGKKPKNANSERDFVWMKGNKFSTVRTVMEKYVQTTLGDKSSKLVMGYEIVQPDDQMQELDYFADRLCVFRVLPSDHPDLKKDQSFVPGIIPIIPEVIELLDDD